MGCGNGCDPYESDEVKSVRRVPQHHSVTLEVNVKGLLIS